ncbi:MAG: PD40 domain-containing protein [Anaerolineae bacterium]|nr:PD40 domain-containing protein [Anaerolineae bacterium]
MKKLLAVSVLLLWCALTVNNSANVSAYAQGAYPDDAQLIPITVPNVLVVEIIQTREVPRGVEVDFTVGNPQNSLYLPIAFEVGGGAEMPVLASDTDVVWAVLGIIPPKNLLSFSPRTITYTVRFTSTDQFLRIHSSMLDPRGLLMNVAEIAVNHILPRVDSKHLAEAISLVDTTWSTSTTLAANLNCLSNDALSLAEAGDCLSSAINLLGSSANEEVRESFRNFLVAILDHLAPGQFGRATVDLYIDGGTMLSNISNFTDLMVSAWGYLAARQPYSLYFMRPLSSDARVPYPPTPDYPLGPISEVQPRFAWHGLNDVTSYELQIDDDTSFTEPLFAQTGIEGMTYTPSMDFAPNTEYHWRIRAYYDFLDAWSAWSMGDFVTGSESAINDSCHDIAFVSGRDGNDEIYVINPDDPSSVPTNLSRRSSTAEFSPSWSPDCRQIAYLSFLEDREMPVYGTVSFNIFVMNSDGTSPRQVTFTPTRKSDLRWTPDGTRIVFTSFDETKFNTWVVSLESGNLSMLDENDVQTALSLPPIPGFDAKNFIDPIWSPDGARIAVTYDYVEDGATVANDIFVLNADGSGLRNLTEASLADFSPTWSPDGQRLAFTSLRDGDMITDGVFTTVYGEIYVMDVDGANARNITQHPSGDGGPTWAPRILDISGIGVQETFAAQESNILPSVPPCGDAPVTRLAGLNSGRNVIGLGETSVRSTPGGAPIKTMAEGEGFSIVGGPECRQSARGSWQYWWLIRLQDGTEGYAPEGSDGVYWLEPLSPDS